MILRIVKGDNPGQELSIDSRSFAIGREKDNDFIINDPGVSRHHSILRLDGGQWFLEDLGSVNGVAVNARKITEKTALSPGDEITLFNHVFVFAPPDAQPASVQPLKVRKIEQLPGDTSAIAAPASPAAAAAPRDAGSTLMLIAKVVMLLVILALAGYMAMLMFSSSKPDSPEQVELAAAAGGAPAANAGNTDTAAAGTTQTTAMLDPDTLNQLAAPVDEAPLFGQNTDPATADTPIPATRLQPLPQANAPAADEQDGAVPAPAPANAGAAVSIVLVTSDPSEANVLLDGEPIGTTPLLLRDTPAGRHLLELRKDGYETLTRQIQVPDQLPSRPYQLRLKAGTLLITSEPSGAWVSQGRQFLGLTPLLLSDLPAGEHEFILRGPGCDPQKIAASVNAAAGETVKAELKSQLGNIELISRPAGCRVYLDGVPKGDTVAMADNGLRSASFVIKSLTAGPAMLKVEHPSGLSITGKIIIPKGSTLQQTATIWVPTHRLTLIDGSVRVGLLLEENQLGDVVLEEANRRTARYLKPQITDLQTMNNDEITEFVAQSNKGRQDAAAGAGDQAMELTRKDDLAMSVADMLQDQRRLTFNDFDASYRDKQIRISGNTTTRYKDTAGNIVVEFGTRAIQCTFEKNTSNEDWEIISQAAKNNAPISVRGICEGIKNKIVVLSNCSLAQVLE